MQEKVPDRRPTLPFGTLTEKDVQLFKAKLDYSEEIRAYQRYKYNQKKKATTISVIIFAVVYFIILLLLGYWQDSSNIFLGFVRALIKILKWLIPFSIIAAFSAGKDRQPNWFPFSKLFWIELPAIFVDNIMEYLCKLYIPNYDFIANYKFKQMEYKRYLQLCKLFDNSIEKT